MPTRSVVLQRIGLFTSLALLFVGCDRDDTDINVYKVAKAEDPKPSAAPNRPASPPPGDELSGDAPSQIIGTAPPEWEIQPPAQLRQASFLVRGRNNAVADISLVILGGGAGGDLDNVNRWRRQLGQEPWTEALLAESSDRITTAIGNGILVDLEGLAEGGDATKDGRIVAAIIARGDETWFFKMRGNADLAAAQKLGFRRWVESVRIGSVEANPPNAKVPPLAWKIPEGWQTGAPAPMRFATFTVAGPDDTSADISVVTFPGDAGGDLANVNRWLGQLGLDPVDEAGLATIVTPLQTTEAMLRTVDLENDGNRMLAGWTLHDGRSWFFKMTGPDELVDSQKTAFEAFLKSLHFHH